MNLEIYRKKLISSETFKSFIKDNPDAYLCSVFIILIKEDNNQASFDYFSKKEGIVSFQIEPEIKKIPVEGYKKAPEKLPDKIISKMDFELINNLILKKMQKEKIDGDITKAILTIQNSDGRSIIIGSIFLSMLSMISLKIDIEKNEIVFFEKKSLSDIIRVVKK